MSQPNGETTETVVTEPNQGENGTENSQTTMTLDQALAELKKVRSEAASRRVALREQEEAAKKWAEYEESQKTELQKLQDAVAERDRKIAEKELEVTRSKIAKQFNVADEDLDLLVGDEENMKRLAERLGTKQDAGTSQRPVDLLAGNRGTAPGKGGQPTTVSFMDSLIRGK
jgi:phage-related minor tail protein